MAIAHEQLAAATAQHAATANDLAESQQQCSALANDRDAAHDTIARLESEAAAGTSAQAELQAKLERARAKIARLSQQQVSPHQRPDTPGAASAAPSCPSPAPSAHTQSAFARGRCYGAPRGVRALAPRRQRNRATAPEPPAAAAAVAGMAALMRQMQQGGRQLTELATVRLQMLRSALMAGASVQKRWASRRDGKSKHVPFVPHTLPRDSVVIVFDLVAKVILVSSIVQPCATFLCHHMVPHVNLTNAGQGGGRGPGHRRGGARGAC